MPTSAQLQPPTAPQAQPVPGTTSKQQTSIALGGSYDPLAIQKEFDRLHASINTILVEMLPLTTPVISAVPGGSTLAETITALNQVIANLNALVVLVQQAGLLQTK